MYKWKFFKSARCVQVKLEKGEDLAALKELAKVPVDELVERRYEKIRSYGNFH